MADENYFDSSASPTLPQDDPLRQWISSVQSDPQLAGLMATDPQGAMNRMRELGIPPPPQGFLAYTDGMSKENSPTTTVGGQNPPLPTQVVGGAPPQQPYPQGGDPMTAGTPPRSLLQRGADAVGGMFRLDPTAYGNWQKQNPLPDFAEAPQPTTGTPVPQADPRKGPPQNFFDPEPTSTLAQEEQTNTPTDVSAQKKPKFGDALSDFGKSLQGVKPPPQVPPQRISSPNAPAHPAIQTQNLNGLLSLVGQRAPEVALTLGRLLATGKA